MKLKSSYSFLILLSVLFVSMRIDAQIINVTNDVKWIGILDESLSDGSGFFNLRVNSVESLFHTKSKCVLL